MSETATPSEEWTSEDGRDYLLITHDSLETVFPQLLERCKAAEAGGISSFLGTTRDTFEGKTVVRLEYDSYIPMALQQLQVIINNARERWELSHVALAHRLGEVAVKQTSVVCMLYIYI